MIGNPLTGEPFRIDVHQHILPPDYVSALDKLGITSSGGRPLPEWDIQSSLALMDRYEIATTVTSLSLIHI